MVEETEGGALRKLEGCRVLGWVARVLLAGAVTGGCQFDAVTVPAGIERPVVHAVLNPWSPEQVVLVERTLTGRVTVDDEARFNRNDPILTGGGVPIRFATVRVRDDQGAVVFAVEDASVRSDGRGAGVYRFRNPASPSLSPNPSLPALDVRPGRGYDLLIVTPQGDSITGETSIPLVQNVPPGGSTRAFNRDTDTLRLFWEPIQNTKRYLIRVDSPWGPMYLFTSELEARLPGTLRNVFQENIPSVFLPGFRSTVSLAAVDVNYFDYFRSANDPFTGTGLINRLDGAFGVFGAVAELSATRLLVTANIDDPIEGRYVRAVPSGQSIVPSDITLFVESEAGEKTFLTGEFTGNADIPSASVVGLAEGTRVSLALMRFENDVSDTVGVFTGQIAGDSLIGEMRIPGRFGDEVRYGKPPATTGSLARPALRTDPGDHEAVAGPRVPVPLGDEHGHPLEPFVPDLGDSAADGAHEVLVVRHPARRLEALESLSEIALDDEPAAEEHLERPVDRRRPDVGAPRAELQHDVFGGQVTVRSEHDLGDRQPLRGDREIVLAQIRAKLLDYVVSGHGGPPSAARSDSVVSRSGSPSSPARR